MKNTKGSSNPSQYHSADGQSSSNFQSKPTPISSLDTKNYRALLRYHFWAPLSLNHPWKNTQTQRNKLSLIVTVATLCFASKDWTQPKSNQSPAKQLQIYWAIIHWPRQAPTNKTVTIKSQLSNLFHFQFEDQIEFSRFWSQNSPKKQLSATGIKFLQLFSPTR